jgi:hypothetical protein
MRAVGSAVHEDLGRRLEITGISNQSFGYTFAAILTGIGLWPLRHGRPLRYWALGAGGAFLLTTIFTPSALGALNRGWTHLGALLNRIVSPIVSALVFFVTVTPIGVIRRLSGKDPLRLRADEKAESYWLVRQPPGPDPRTMSNQF